MKRLLPFLALLAALIASSPHAQPPVAPPEVGDDPDEQDQALPALGQAAPDFAGDPKAYWTGPNRAPVQVDPLGDRRAAKNQPRVVIPGAAPALLYRLWGLPPLQTMVLRPGEAVIEVWVRPSGASHEAIARLTLRRDGKVFIQARAGMGCCRPEIARRVDIDAVVEAKTEVYRALAKSPVWAQPAEVEVVRPGVVTSICLKGSAYDLTLLEYGRAAHLRRICDSEAVGSVAPVLETVLSAAIGRDPRFDALFRGGADFSFEAGQYDQLIAEGGSLKAKPFNP